MTLMPADRLRSGAVRRAFSLVELMVVVLILAVLIAVAVPAIGPVLASNEHAQVVNSLQGLFTTAQTLAEASVTPVGIRFERATRVMERKLSYQKLDQHGNPVNEEEVFTLMQKDSNGQALYLDHQQARLVQFSADRTQCFQVVPGTKVVDLPSGAWVAPSSAVELDASGNPLQDSKGNQLWILTDNELRYQPVQNKSPYSVNNDATSFNRLETFFLIFDRSGRVVQFPADPNDPSTHYWYRDPLQAYTSGNNLIIPEINHPDPSPRGIIIYDRKAYEELPNLDSERRNLLMKSRMIYVNRSLGSTLEGQLR